MHRYTLPMHVKRSYKALISLGVVLLWALTGWLWFTGSVAIDNIRVEYPLGSGQAQMVTMPFTLRSEIKFQDFEVRATIHHHPIRRGLLRFAPDDCLKGATLNDRDISSLFRPNLCWPQMQNIDLSPYLRPGENQLVMRLHDYDITYGVRIAGVRSVPEILLIAGLLSASFYLLLKALKQSLRTPRWVGREGGTYLLVSLLPCIGFILMTITEWPRFGFDLSMLRVQLGCCWIAFLLWVRHVELFGPHPPTANPAFFSLALAGFVVGSALFGQNMQELRLIFIWGALLCCVFTFARPKQLLALLRQHKRVSVVAALGASCATLYFILQETIWGWMVYSTGILLRTLFLAIGIEATVKGSSSAPVFLKTDYFHVHIYQPCSGLEGIFLFFFLLSVLLILDWKTFSRFRIWPLYVFGYVYMYIMNAVRISALFLLGHWSWQDDAPTWMRSLRGAPFELFHSYTGWVVYLLAFIIFANWMYRRGRRLLLSEACGRPYE